jgi:uncharacterized phage protein (TIGR02216 family)
MALYAQSRATSPSEFWRLSLREWRAFNAAPGAALNRTAFEALTSRYPDERTR